MSAPDRDLWKVTPVPASDLGRIDQWGASLPIGYFPVEPITSARLAEIVRDPFSGGAADTPWRDDEEGKA